MERSIYVLTFTHAPTFALRASAGKPDLPDLPAHLTYPPYPPYLPYLPYRGGMASNVFWMFSSTANVERTPACR